MKKIAIVHDGIFCRGGGERVLLKIINAFPNADIYTSIYDSENTFPEFKKYHIRVTWLQHFVKNERMFKLLFYPSAILAMQSLDLRNYDLLIITGTHCSKYIKASPKAAIVYYCFTPFRLAWNPSSYSAYLNSSGIKKIALEFIISRLKKIDYKHAQKITNFIAMTDETAQRIRDAYGFSGEVAIINPSIDTSKFEFSNEHGDFYLIVSRLEKYKMVELAIQVFNDIGKKLIIIGQGTEKENLKKQAKSNILFYESMDDAQLIDFYKRCKALIFPQHEDYGLTPIEANACGKPVIAYSKGGVRATQIPYSNENPNKWTAIFFEEQSKDSLEEAIKLFESLEPDRSFIKEHSKKFDDTIFQRKILQYVSGVMDTNR